MNDLKTLNKIIEFADHAHSGQMRKYSSERYIVHPIRVMKTCSQYTESLPVLAAAILHDVIEGTPLKENDILRFLRHYMNEEDRNFTIRLVNELTDVFVKKNFPALNRFRRKEMELERLRMISPEAQTIKYADIIDNVKDMPESDPDFAKRYLQECYCIVTALTTGNQELRTIALELIDALKKKLQSNNKKL